LLDRIPFGPILVILTILSGILYPVAVLMGWFVSRGWLSVPTHVQWSIPITLLSIFTHAIIMFYFIGTGSRIKEVVKEFKLDVRLYRRTLPFKARVFPLSMLTMGAIMVSTIIGGGTHTNFPWTPPWLHGVLALAAALLNGVLALREIVCISENLTLVDDVDLAVFSATR
jgi:hypothetical protein